MRTTRAALVVAMAIAGTLAGERQAVAQRSESAADGEIRVFPVRGNIYMFVGSTSNIAVSIGGDGALVVDSGSVEMSPKVVTAIQKLLGAVNASSAPAQPCLGCVGVASRYFNEVTASPAAPQPLRFIINTNALSHHVDGNETLSRAGRTLGGGNVESLLQEEVQEGALILAHENVLRRMSEASRRLNHYALPQDVYNRDMYKFYRFFNGEAIQLYHQPAAITDGDSIVHFRYSDVIVTGDVFTTTGYPRLDLNQGGSVQGVIDSLNRIIDLAVTENNMQGGTMIVPGHGLCDASDVVHYRDVVTIIRDRVQHLIEKNMTLAQIKAARPTFDYDRRYSTSEWTGDMFVEAVYNSLEKQ